MKADTKREKGIDKEKDNSSREGVARVKWAADWTKRDKRETREEIMIKQDSVEPIRRNKQLADEFNTNLHSIGWNWIKDLRVTKWKEYKNISTRKQATKWKWWKQIVERLSTKETEVRW